MAACIWQENWKFLLKLSFSKKFLTHCSCLKLFTVSPFFQRCCLEYRLSRGALPPSLCPRFGKYTVLMLSPRERAPLPLMILWDDSLKTLMVISLLLSNHMSPPTYCRVIYFHSPKQYFLWFLLSCVMKKTLLEYVTCFLSLSFLIFNFIVVIRLMRPIILTGFWVYNTVFLTKGTVLYNRNSIWSNWNFVPCTC